MSPEQKTIWMFVGAAFQDGHPACEDCSHKKVNVKRHPYQEGTASEYWSDCTLNSGNGEATDCPAWREHVEQLAAEAQE